MTIIKSITFDIHTGKNYSLMNYLNQEVITRKLFQKSFSENKRLGYPVISGFRRNSK